MPPLMATAVGLPVRVVVERSPNGLATLCASDWLAMVVPEVELGRLGGQAEGTLLPYLSSTIAEGHPCPYGRRTLKAVPADDV
jgi:hypothetical protein